MRRSGYEATRLALFIKSYAGHYFIEGYKNSRHPDVFAKKLARILLFPEAIFGFFLCPKFSGREVEKTIKNIVKDKDKIRIYLKIEKQLTLLIRDKHDKDGYVLEEYENALLALAIERVSGDSVSNIKNDDKFEKELANRKQIYNYWYYSVARKYRLPTLKIIPFVSRLLKI